MPSLGTIYGSTPAQVAAAKARREKAARKRLESWKRMCAAFAASRST